jgi:pimeloyl-ACP methyl ester carboxylesterase
MDPPRRPDGTATAGLALASGEEPIMQRSARTIRLADGRRLGFDEHGAPDGIPVLYFHGSPSSRLEWVLFGPVERLQRHGLRLVAVDRPGLGLSDFQPDRRMIDWPADVRALADHLGWERFAVLGYSGGSAYAAACAWAMPERLTATAMVAAVAPFELPGVAEGIPGGNLRFLMLSRDRPRAARAMQAAMGLVVRFAPNRVLASMASALPAPDRAVIADPDLQRAFLRMVRESGRQGVRGPQVDSALMVSPWGFDPAEIRVPVSIWKGKQDQNAPLAMAEHLARVIPQSRLTVYPEDGHISVVTRHADAIFGAIRAEHERIMAGRPVGPAER